MNDETIQQTHQRLETFVQGVERLAAELNVNFVMMGLAARHFGDATEAVGQVAYARPDPRVPAHDLGSEMCSMALEAATALATHMRWKPDAVGLSQLLKFAVENAESLVSRELSGPAADPPTTMPTQHGEEAAQGDEATRRGT